MGISKFRQDRVELCSDTDSISEQDCPVPQESRILPPTRKTSSPSVSPIRSRYLYRLGLWEVPGVLPHQTCGDYPPEHGPLNKTLSRQVRKGILKATNSSSSTSISLLESSEEDLSSEDSTTTSSGSYVSSRSTGTNSLRSVSFPYIHLETIHPIPTRKMYTPEELRQLWWSPKEAQALISKNVLEFEFEGWKWENVIEEDGFVTVESSSSSTTSQILHPAQYCILRYQQQLEQQQYWMEQQNLLPASMVQRQFCKILMAQQQQQRQRLKRHPSSFSR